jgi:hypothetical protein
MASMSKSAIASTSNEKKLENSRSLVWQYFERDKTTQIATSSLCKSKLKSVGGSTGSLHVHLHSKHKITLLKRKSTGDDDGNDDASRPFVEPPSANSACDGSASATKRQDKGNLTKYFGAGRHNSQAATVSRMTVCDGMSFHILCSSPDLRRTMSAAGRDLQFTNYEFTSTLILTLYKIYK